MVKLLSLFEVANVEMHMSHGRPGRSTTPAINSDYGKRLEANGIDGGYQLPILHEPFGTRPVGIDFDAESIRSSR